MMLKIVETLIVSVVFTVFFWIGWNVVGNW